MNLAELELFIQELHELAQSKKNSLQKPKLSSTLDVFTLNKYTEKESLSETEIKVYITINHYFRLVTITIPNLSVAYELWLKGILQILLAEVGLTLDNWDRICTIGDHDSDIQELVDAKWTAFLERIQRGHMNEEVWDLIQKGKRRSNELLNKRILIRKKRQESES